MPVHCTSTYCQWGNQTKYYFNPSNPSNPHGKHKAYEKATRQGRAIRMSQTNSKILSGGEIDQFLQYVHHVYCVHTS